jgi:hypothetical protein
VLALPLPLTTNLIRHGNKFVNWYTRECTLWKYGIAKTVFIKMGNFPDAAIGSTSMTNRLPEFHLNIPY